MEMMGHPPSHMSNRTGFPNLYRLVILLSILHKATLFFGGLGAGAADPTAGRPGFVSLDCGAASATYTTQGLTWTPDDGFGLEGVSETGPVNGPPYNPPAQYTTIRYFAGNQSKYCYTFDGVAQKQVYLVRASFWLGAGAIPFATPNPQQVSFQLIINSDVWDNISISLPQTDPVVKEVYVDNTATLSVCLAGRSIGLDTPFISSLEIRPLSALLDAVLRVTRGSQALFLHSRVNYGSSTGNDIRFPDDIFDRIWSANTTGPRISAMGTFILANDNYSDNPPYEVLRTALLSADSATLNISLNVSTVGKHPYFFMLYFFEVNNNVTGPGQSSFSETVIDSSGKIFVSQNITVLDYQYPLALFYNNNFDVLGEGGGSLHFNMEKLPTSIYGPFITAIELFRISNQEMSLGANTTDVAAIDSIRKGIDGFDGWSGDPCLPYAFNGLSCSNHSRPRVVSLNLSNKNIVGKIPSSISVLTSLVELDFQGNKLNGSIPEFLAQLPDLRILNLQDNNLSGAIPTMLLNKANKGALNMSLAGNPFLCNDKNNQSFCLTNPIQTQLKHKNHASLMGGIAGALVGALIFLGLWAYFYMKRRRNESAKETTSNVLSHTQVVECANQARHFTYKEIQAISNMFKTKLAQGSFGPVYYGCLHNEMKVALKVSQQGSTQGPQQFLNEARLLSRIHHRNLVTLIGYCIEESLVLVYEYMLNGSLHNLLFGDSKRALSWLERLNIIVGSAEGLEYLHKGCSPSIIHRDVKTSNILLDDEMVAKISDFGISRASFLRFDKNSQPEMVTEVQGTYGYLDPEHFQTHQITEKTDVYAFGVVLLEVVSGRPPIQQGQLHIVEWVQSFVERGDIGGIVDPSIANDDYNVSAMWKIVETALSCVHDESRMRPDMSEVTSELKLALSIQLQNQLCSNYYHKNFLNYVHAR